MNSFIYMLYPKRYINSLEKKFKRLGSSNKIDINIFLITRLILEFIIFILLLLIPVYGLILSILFTVLFHFLYEDLILNSRLIKREKIILDSLKDVLELEPKNAEMEAEKMKLSMSDETINKLAKYVHNVLNLNNLNCNYDVNKEKCRSCVRRKR